jgi:predicted nucleotidyltransferase
MHMAIEDSALEEIVSRLVRAFAPERIHLFGSRVAGAVDADSDYDLMVVVADAAPAERRGSRRAYEALRGTGIAADVLVWTRSAFDSRLHLRASFPSTIVREGRLIYGAEANRIS